MENHKKIKEKNSNSVLNLPALAHVLPAHETICTKFSFTQTPVQNCACGLPLHGLNKKCKSTHCYEITITISECARVVTYSGISKTGEVEF